MKPNNPRKKSMKKGNLNKADEFIMNVVFWPVKVILDALFYIIRYIFVRNKCSRQYWNNRREWRKTMRRLRSRAQNDIIVSSILPVLEKQGFQQLPYPCWWGWCNQGRGGYEYELARLKDEKLQTLKVETFYGYSYIVLSLGSYILKPNIASISDLSEYGSEIFFKAQPYSPKCYPSCRFKACSIKLCKSEARLRKKVSKIKNRIKTKFFDLDKIYSDWDKEYTPGIIDLAQFKNGR